MVVIESKTIHVFFITRSLPLSEVIVKLVGATTITGKGTSIAGNCSWESCGLRGNAPLLDGFESGLLEPDLPEAGACGSYTSCFNKANLPETSCAAVNFCDFLGRGTSTASSAYVDLLSPFRGKRLRHLGDLDKDLDDEVRDIPRDLADAVRGIPGNFRSPSI